MGYQVPPGISDATVPNPIFNLTPAATVDEGNNWINISWGPLALTNPAHRHHSRQLRPDRRFAGHQLHPVDGYHLRCGALDGLLRQSEEDQQRGGCRRGGVPSLLPRLSASLPARWPSATWCTARPARRRTLTLHNTGNAPAPPGITVRSRPLRSADIGWNLRCNPAMREPPAPST